MRAAQEIGLLTVPTVRLSHLSTVESRAYVLADNKLALNAGWDADLLVTELQGLIDLDFDVELTGFSLAEIDIALNDAKERLAQDVAHEDGVPAVPAHPVTREGEIWILGRHRLLCGDARDARSLSLLLRTKSTHKYSVGRIAPEAPGEGRQSN